MGILDAQLPNQRSNSKSRCSCTDRFGAPNLVFLLDCESQFRTLRRQFFRNISVRYLDMQKRQNPRRISRIDPPE